MAQVQEQVALILVHGGASSGRMYTEVQSLLKEKYQYPNIYIPDLPGHGKDVEAGPFSFEKSTKSLLKLIREIKSSKSSIHVSIIGISLGGQAVLDLVSNHPSEVDSVIVSGCSIAPPDAEIGWVMPRLPTEDPNKMQMIMEDAGLLKQEDLESLQKSSLGFTFDPPPGQKTNAPILVVVGQYDMPMAVRDFKPLVEKVKEFSTSDKTRGQELAGAWHNHSIDVPEAFTELIDLWNRGVFGT